MCWGRDGAGGMVGKQCVHDVLKVSAVLAVPPPFDLFLMVRSPQTEPPFPSSEVLFLLPKEVCYDSYAQLIQSLLWQGQGLVVSIHCQNCVLCTVAYRRKGSLFSNSCQLKPGQSSSFSAMGKDLFVVLQACSVGCSVFFLSSAAAQPGARDGYDPNLSSTVLVWAPFLFSGNGTPFQLLKNHWASFPLAFL